MRRVWMLGIVGLGVADTAVGEAAQEPIPVVVSATGPGLCVSRYPGERPVRRKDRAAVERGLALLRQGEPEGALVSLAEAGSHPTAVSARAIAEIYTAEREASLPEPPAESYEIRLRRAEAIHRDLLAGHGSDPCLLEAAAITALAVGDATAARSRVDAAWRLSPGDPDVALLRALMLYGEQPDAAVELLETTVARHPEHVPSAFQLADLRLFQERYDEAYDLYQVAAAAGADVSAPMLEAAWGARRLDRYLSLASASGAPLGDGGALAAAADPVAAWRSLLGIPEGGGLVAIIETDLGELRCDLYPDYAPITVSSFVGLSRGTMPWIDPATGRAGEGPIYDGALLHRVIPEFMVQGGDPTGTGQGGPGYQFRNEVRDELRFDRPGRLAMANAGPDTNGSQFFVTEVPTPFLDGGYTIFGTCDEAAVDVVTRIARLPRDDHDRPFTPVAIRHVRIEARPAEDGI